MIFSITPFLWFDNQAEEAARFYTSVFPDSEIEEPSPSGDATSRELCSVLSVTFRLHGQRFIALNGGPHYTFTPAISFVVSCETQDELDDLWTKLTEGGEDGDCGWLRDRFGLSWQIVPAILHELLGDDDEAKAESVMQAMLKMRKLDIAELRAAHARG